MAILGETLDALIFFETLNNLKIDNVSSYEYPHKQALITMVSLLQSDLFHFISFHEGAFHNFLENQPYKKTILFINHFFYSSKFFKRQVFELPDGAIILNTSRGGVVSEKDFLELDDDHNYIRLISDVFENEPNINEDFLNKNLFATPHIAGHSQFARYQMTKMAYENVMNFLGQDIIERNSILENRIINFEKNIFDKDMKEFGLPVTLMLDTYNPKSDVFNYKDFKKVRDNYNNRIGYSQATIKGCSEVVDCENLKLLGFTVEEN